MFKNALIYRIESWQPPALPELDQRLAAGRFAECGATQPESAGWVEPRGERHGAFAESVAGHWLLKLCTETKAVPASVVKRRLDEQLQKIEAETGRRPKGKHAKELKEALVHELLPRAFPKRFTTWVWIDPSSGLVVIDAASLKKADGIATRLVELLGGTMRLAPLQTERSPASCMADWLVTREAPAGFTLDRDCELKQPDSEKATVRYARHALEIDEVAGHIQQGKLPTQLAMTWSDRVSFVLTETMTLKKLKLLDVVLEGTERAGRDDKGFDTDAAIFTGELSRLIPDLVAALGGELQRDKPPVTPAAEARGADPAPAGGEADERRAASELPWEV
jgi:recombination associated protein RdgC